ncbi:Heat-inducible transcription repressor HrcA [Streptomyces microflavus]
MLSERRLEVLRAIVQDYVGTEEPVGSKALTERHQLGVSPATVRNDMAVLEDEGFIAQPHTSAGRIPTDKGYRLFVDKLAGVKPLSSPERRAIQNFLDGAVDLDDVVGRTVRLLAQLTRQVAVVQYPSLTRSTVRHVELLSLAPARLMLVLITRSTPLTRCSDPQKKQVYDLGGDPLSANGGGGAGGFGAGGFGNFSDIMDAFFGTASQRGPRSRTRRGQDAMIRLEIDLSEAAFGTTKDIRGRHGRRLQHLQRRGRRPRHLRPDL